MNIFSLRFLLKTLDFERKENFIGFPMYYHRIYIAGMNQMIEQMSQYYLPTPNIYY